MTALGPAHGLSRHRVDRLGPANRVTLVRATLAVGVAALVADSFVKPARVGVLVALAAVALVLDAVDGWVARRTRTASALGARFDGEVDAFLILVLSVYVARSVGPWVLAIGLARYAFGAAGLVAPWMRETLPPRWWRKLVAATQGIVLTVAAAAIAPRTVTVGLLVGALILLAESFGRDVLWLKGNTQPDPPTASDPGPTPTGNSDRPTGRGRRVVGTALTIGAALLVWAVLVAPDRAPDISVSAFLRVPLELLVVIVLAVVLPKTPRRIMAVVAGLLLALVLVLKVIDYEVFNIYDRAFEPIGDVSQIGTGLETLRSVVGSTETTLIEIGVIVGIAAGVVLLTLSMLRLTRVAADNSRWTLRILTGVGAVWALCWVFGAQLIARTPIASTIGAGIVVDNVEAVASEIHDEHVFAAQIKHDSFANTPTDRLLTGLRGKNVLLVFVESYGQLAVHGAKFSPEVDHALAVGNRRLARAGFSARSAYVKSATFGGISWLAQSSLLSGLWVNNQTRYNELMPQDRFNLATAFKQAGYRTVDYTVADDRPWPQGERYYHWDKIYDRYQVGYHGPGFTYAPMPDQYIYSSLNRLELSKARKKPLFAEVDTVSSHMPWNRIPEMIPWNKVGNGSVYNHTAEIHETGNFWGDPPRVQAAYGKSIVYSLNALTSFVQHYGSKNLVLIVLGDEQPLPIVSGTHPNHDVPISIIAHDPKVLERIKGWGWNAGLRPRRNAPVWIESAFRNRFLTAFDTPAGH